jgi:hypothetical protein
VREIVLAAGKPSEERRRRLDRAAELFGVEGVERVAERRGKKVSAAKELNS